MEMLVGTAAAVLRNLQNRPGNVSPKWKLIPCCGTSTLQRLFFEVAQIDTPKQQSNMDPLFSPDLTKNPTPFSTHPPYQRHE
jgi:hypothetical protein